MFKKKYIAILGILIVLGSISVVAAHEFSDTILVPQGETFTYNLDSNPSTGYYWTVEFDQSHIELISQVHQQENSSKPICGQGGKDIFTFKTISEGSSEIIFKLISPSKEIVQTKIVSVKVV